MSAKTFSADAFLARFDRMDAQLVAKGFHKTSAWWRTQFERFLRSGRRRWVIRAGRRAGKSSFLCRLAVAWALWGPWSVPSGDVAVIPFVSVDRDEAGARIRTVRDILKALDIAADVRTEEIELTDRVCIFRVETCSIRTVGFTAIMIVADEMARYESRDTAANPAREVMRSLRPTMATQDLAFEVCSSSPWGTDDYHAELCDAGNNNHQIYSFAETWTANPTISEQRTHELEPDERIWSREYAAIPGATITQALDRDDALAAFAPFQFRAGSPFVSLDASSLRGDAFAWIHGHLAKDFIGIEAIKAFEGERLRHVSMATVVDTIAADARRIGSLYVLGDQREEASLRALFRQKSINFRSYAWTEPSKDAAFQLLRRVLKEHKLHIVEHAVLRRQMLECKAHLRPSGRTHYATNGLDYLSALVTLMHAADAKHVDIDTEANGSTWVCADRGGRNTDGTYERGSIHVGGGDDPFERTGNIAEDYKRMVAFRRAKLLEG